jgi:hypothetical protein
MQSREVDVGGHISMRKGSGPRGAPPDATGEELASGRAIFSYQRIIGFHVVALAARRVAVESFSAVQNNLAGNGLPTHSSDCAKWQVMIQRQPELPPQSCRPQNIPRPIKRQTAAHIPKLRACPPKIVVVAAAAYMSQSSNNIIILTVPPVNPLFLR